MIDYCLTFGEQYVSYIQDENKFNNIYKLYRNKEGMGQRLLTATEKVWIVGQGLKIYSFVVTTMNLVFSKIYKRGLLCEGSVTLSKHATHYSTRSGIITDNPPLRWLPTICHPGMDWAALWVLALWTFTSTHFCYKY